MNHPNVNAHAEYKKSTKPSSEMIFCLHFDGKVIGKVTRCSLPFIGCTVRGDSPFTVP